MASSYQLSIRYEVYQELSKVRGAGRERVIAWLESIQSNPHGVPDYSEQDAGGQPVGVKLVGRFAIFYHVDHAIQEVRVLKLVRADR